MGIDSYDFIWFNDDHDDHDDHDAGDDAPHVVIAAPGKAQEFAVYICI